MKLIIAIIIIALMNDPKYMANWDSFTPIDGMKYSTYNDGNFGPIRHSMLPVITARGLVYTRWATRADRYK